MMFNNNANQNFYQMNQATELLNTFNRYWAALKNNQAIRTELDLEAQINSIRQNLSMYHVLQNMDKPSEYGLNIGWQDFPYTFQDTVSTFSQIVGWDFLSSAIFLLTGTSMALCGSVTVSVAPDWQEPLNIYALGIASSGANKSGAIRNIKKPFVDFIDEERLKYDQNADRHQFSHSEQRLAIKKTCRGKINNTLTKMIKANSLDYNEIASLVDAETNVAYDAMERLRNDENLSRPSLFLSDSTSKGLQVSLLEQGEFQAICEPEGDLLLKLAYDARFDISLLLKSYGREEHTFGKHPKKVTLTSPSLCILNAVQPEVATKFYTMGLNTVRGLSSRFLPIFVCHQAPSSISANLETYDRLIKAMLTRYYDQNKNRKKYTLTIHSNALQLIQNFQRITKNLISGGFDHMESFLHKLRGHACRLAGALHLWVQFQDGNQDEIISAKTMELAISLATALIAQADYAYNPLCLPAVNDAKRIKEWMTQSQQASFDLRSLTQSTSINKAQALPALNALERHNILRQIITPKGSVICVVNPNFHSLPLRPYQPPVCGYQQPNICYQPQSMAFNPVTPYQTNGL